MNKHRECVRQVIELAGDGFDEGTIDTMQQLVDHTAAQASEPHIDDLRKMLMIAAQDEGTPLSAAELLHRAVNYLDRIRY